ncbi:helix-turn-helix domain-containing protein [Sulfurimonas sp. NW7]|uniref:hypothetical protein n=1 Tax=Sulfurimonas sp. NW7 TaxID=2922727 RepID=UPI003DA7DD90
MEQIPAMLKLLEKISEDINKQVDKRWLSTKEAALYLGYSIDSINAKVKSGDFLPGYHYYQNSSKRMFDRAVLDKWVMGKDYQELEADMKNTVESIVEKIVA